MTHILRKFTILVVGVLAGCAAFGCGDASADRAGGWVGTADTLASGTIVVHNGGPAIWDSASAWRLVEETRIGAVEGDGPEVFSAVYDVALDPLGRIWALDRDAKSIRVFEADGRFVRTIGREGAGPGEFEDPIGMAWDGNGRLFVVDPGNARYAVFDTAGAYLRGYRRLVGGYSLPWPGGFGEDGTFFERASVRVGDDFEGALIRYEVPASLDSALVPMDTIWLPSFDGESFVLTTSSGRMSARVPFSPYLTWTFDPRGYVWSAITGDYSIARQKLAGDTSLIVQLETEPIEVTTAERESAVEGLKWFTSQGGTMDPSRIPGTKPALRSVRVDDDGYLWVMPTLPGDRVPDHTTPVINDIFSPDGRYLGRVEGGPRRPAFARGRVIGVENDELGVDYVVVYRIEGREPGAWPSEPRAVGDPDDR